MYIYPAYTSKHNLNHENKIILLMIPNGQSWHYLAVKKVICIIKRNNNKIYWWFLLFKLCSFYQNKKQKLCGNKDFCGVLMPSKATKIIKFIQ